MKQSQPRPLDRMLLRLLLWRLFLPSLVITLLAVAATAWVREQSLEARQLLLARSLAHTVDDYLEHATRVLGAVAQIAEVATPEELSPYMYATWQMYEYFDTLYHLDEGGFVTVLAPPNPRYQGLDLSNQPYFQQSKAQTEVTISPPLNSMRTGQLVVYTVWPLAGGGMVVGELNLGALQEAIATGGDEQYFITDRSGNLLAHPQSDLVAQSTNVGNLEIVQRGLVNEATLPYSADGTFVLGSATQVKSTGWVVVAQVPLLTAYRPYALSVGVALLLAPIVWLSMILDFRQQLRHHVVAPLARLSQGAEALADGDFAQGEALAAIPAAFTEVNTLGADFYRMSQAIQVRQAALQESEEKYRTILENIEDGYFETDIAGNFTFFNDAMCRILGYAEDELMGMNNRQYMDEKVAKEVYKTFNAVYRTGKPAQAFDWELVRKDGARRFVETSISLIRDSTREPAGFRSILRDVTERKQREEEIRQRTAQLEALRQVGLELTAQLDLDTLLHSIVSHAIELLGGIAGGFDLYQPDRDVMEWTAYTGFDSMPGESFLHRGEGLSGKILETGEPLIVNNYQEWEGRATIWEGYPFAAVVGTPVRWGDEFLGVLNVDSETPGAFSSADTELLGMFATQAAIAIRNARLYEETRSRTAHLEALNAIITAAAAAPDLSSLLEITLGHTLTALRLEMGDIWLADQHAIRGLPPEFGPATIQKAQAAELDTPYPVAVEDWQQVRDEGPLLAIAPVMDRFAVRASLSVPILVEEGRIGGMTVASPVPRSWPTEEIALAEAVGRQLGAAAERLRLFQAEQEQRELAEALAEAAAAVSGTLDPDEVLDRILEQVERIVPGETFNVMLLEGDIAQRVRWRGYEHLNVSDHVLRLATPVAKYPYLARMRDSGEPVVVPDTSIDPEWVPSEDKKWRRSYVAAPVRVGSATVGFLNVTSTQPGQLGPADAQRLKAFANHAATAIENARLFEETQQRVAELETLQRTSLQLTSSLDLSAVLDSIVASALTLVGATDCHIYLYDEADASFTLGAVLWENGRREAAVEAPRHDGLTATVAREGHPIVINNATRHPLYTTPEAREWNMQAIAGFPLKRAGRTLGVLNVGFLVPHTFSQEEQRVLGLLANQAAIAIENAQLYRQLRDHAEQLEQRVQERTAQLQAQYARLDAILRSASDGIVVTDGQGEIVQANPVAQVWLTQALSPEDAAQLQEAIQNLARQTEERPERIMELTGLDLELKSAPISEPVITLLPASWGLGEEEAATVVAVHDVSHLKALDRMKSRFVTNVSHELRTPITTIKLYARLLQQMPPEDEKWGQYLDALAEEADHQARLVEDILQISRIDAGRLEMEPCPTPVNELAKAAIASHRVLAERKGLTIEHHPSSLRSGGGEPVALVDPERMMQVLNNLVGNAILYTPEGGKVIVSTGTEEAEGRIWATATVADTGMGISDEELPHIFERFFRGVEPRSMQISGTGLGLAIVKEIVELHGGWVTVESEVDVGTTFTVWLPLTD